jgi:hypothetical protein
MECELWPQLYRIVLRAGRKMPKVRGRYSDALILVVLLWSCLHDRPLTWGCEARNWISTRARPAHLPSDSTVSRRLWSRRVLTLMQIISADLRGTALPSLWKILDGKCLIIGSCSKDPDARPGHAIRGMGLGYKLHVIYGERLMPEAWDVRPLNVNEKVVAHDLVNELEGGGYLLADGQYDSSRLHDDCRRHNHQLFTPRSSRPSAKGYGHRYLSPHRVHAVEMLGRQFGQAMLAQRRVIERYFGHATIFGGGLAPLPAWVRRHHRVKRWLWAKLLINAVRIMLRKRLTA